MRKLYRSALSFRTSCICVLPFLPSRTAETDAKVSDIGEVEYMENFDNRDADSIFRSPGGSVNGQQSSISDDENQEEKSFT